MRVCDSEEVTSNHAVAMEPDEILVIAVPGYDTMITVDTRGEGPKCSVSGMGVTEIDGEVTTHRFCRKESICPSVS
jgi:hypothetical protein